MQVRRQLTNHGLVTQRLGAEGWSEGPDLVTDSPYDKRWQEEVARAHVARGGGVLPLQPVSLRDFMCSERHVIDASRGLLRRLHPGQHRAVRAVEALTRRPFRALKPGRLFYRQPIYYLANHLTVVPSGTPLRAPSYSRALDYELEVGIVLGAPLLDATPVQAEAAVAGFVLVNDVSARDVQRAEMASGLGPQKSKHFVTTMSCSAATADDVLPRWGSLRGEVRINDRVVSRVDTTDLRWSVGEILAHASRDEPLLPGEVLATGTLAGGSGMETGAWLSDADVLTLTLDGIGEVRHEVVTTSP